MCCLLLENICLGVWYYREQLDTVTYHLFIVTQFGLEDAEYIIYKMVTTPKKSFDIEYIVYEYGEYGIFSFLQLLPLCIRVISGGSYGRAKTGRPA